MKIIPLDSQEKMLDLKKGDKILVEWTNYFVKHHQYPVKCNKIMMYHIHENKKSCSEIICSLKGNHYFNWEMYLGLDTPGVNTSNAIEVYKIDD